MGWAGGRAGKDQHCNSPLSAPPSKGFSSARGLAQPCPVLSQGKGQCAPSLPQFPIPGTRIAGAKEGGRELASLPSTPRTGSAPSSTPSTPASAQKHTTCTHPHSHWVAHTQLLGKGAQTHQYIFSRAHMPRQNVHIPQIDFYWCTHRVAHTGKHTNGRLLPEEPDLSLPLL